MRVEGGKRKRRPKREGYVTKGVRYRIEDRAEELVKRRQELESFGAVMQAMREWNQSTIRSIRNG